MIMPDEFQFDVFLSHSAKDKAVVHSSTLSASIGERAGVRCRSLRYAERLRADGMKVWFDEWVLRPGDSLSPGERARERASKYEEGLERSRVLVLCVSAHAFGSDWARLEFGTFRFRDPLNKERRFLPLRLDDAPTNDSDWFSKDDNVRWQWSGATYADEGSPPGERGGVHQFGVPPKGNASCAWVQHFIYHLAPHGMTGFVLANGSIASNQSGEGDIRQKLIEADLVDCIVALPGQLFYNYALN